MQPAGTDDPAYLDCNPKLGAELKTSFILPPKKWQRSGKNLVIAKKWQKSGNGKRAAKGEVLTGLLWGGIFDSLSPPVTSWVNEAEFTEDVCGLSLSC